MERRLCPIRCGLNGRKQSSSLNISSESVEVSAMPGTNVPRSASGSSSQSRRRSVVAKPRVSGVIKRLPRSASSRGPSPSHPGKGAVDVPMGQHHQELHMHGDRTSHHQGLHLHDDRVQIANVGVDPAEHARVIQEARTLLEEAESKFSSLEGLAQSIYQQACARIQELMNVTDDLRASCARGESVIQNLQIELGSTRVQLREQAALNQRKAALSQQHIDDLARLSQENSNVHRIIERKDAEIQRLMIEVSNANDAAVRCGARLAALSAAPSAEAAPREVSRPMLPGDISSQVMPLMAPLMEAVQTLASRVDELSHNSTDGFSPQRFVPPAPAFPQRVVGFGGGDEMVMTTMGRKKTTSLSLIKPLKVAPVQSMNLQRKIWLIPEHCSVPRLKLCHLQLLTLDFGGQSFCCWWLVLLEYLVVYCLFCEHGPRVPASVRLGSSFGPMVGR